MKTLRLFSLTAVLLAVSSGVFAQVQVKSRDNPGATVKTQPALPVELVEKLSRTAFDALPQAKTSDGMVIGERAKTLSYPLVPLEVREKTIVRGYLAGYASWCGLDWQNNFFLPYMTGVRAGNAGWTDYQFAYVGVLHGLAMKIAEKSKEAQTCTDADKQKVLAQEEK